MQTVRNEGSPEMEANEDSSEEADPEMVKCQRVEAIACLTLINFFQNCVGQRIYIKDAEGNETHGILEAVDGDLGEILVTDLYIPMGLCKRARMRMSDLKYFQVMLED